MTEVKRIILQAIMGLEDMVIEPGKVTIIEGGNGVGKTSILEGIRAGLGGGFDATLVRRGHEEGRAVLVLDDEIEVSKTILASGGGKVSVEHPDFGKVSAPQSYLDGSMDFLGLNPVAFLTATNQAELLLEALPMHVSAEQIAEAGVEPEFIEGVDLEGHALTVIDRIHRRIYDERTGVNRVEKDKRTTAEKLAEGLQDAPTDGDELEAKIRKAKQAKQDLDASLSIQTSQIDRKAQREIEEAHTRRDARVAELQEEIQRVRQAAADQIESVRSAASQARQEMQSDIQPKMAELDREVSALEERAHSVARARATRAVMQEAETEADRHRELSQQLTQMLTSLDALKLRLQDAIPIEGVTIQDGELYVDDVVFRRVNLERKVRVVVDLAKLRAGKIPLVCVDQLECLEQDVFDELVAQLAESPLQPIITRVTKGPLTIRTVEAGGSK